MAESIDQAALMKLMQDGCSAKKLAAHLECVMDAPSRYAGKPCCGGVNHENL